MKEENVTFKNPKGLELVGVLHLPDKKVRAAVVMAHGLAGNKDRPRHIEIAEELASNGFVVLRFDFGGCGESPDRPISVKEQVVDLRAAIDFMKGRGYEKIYLLGESLGGVTSILAWDDDVKTMALLAPVSKSKIVLRYDGCDKDDESNTLFEKDNRIFKLSKDFNAERKAIDQEKILSRIKCKVLIIHGSADDTVPLEHSVDAMRYLPKGSKLEIIGGGSHRLDEHIGMIIPLLVEWFKKIT